MTLAIVIIPSYGDDSLRLRNYGAVVDYLTPVPKYTWRSHRGSPGAARNYGVSHTTESIIVFNDADSIVPLSQLYEAGSLAHRKPGLVFAYDLYVRLSERGTADFIGGSNLDDCASERTIAQSGSMGCVAISRACFNEVGGFDENYLGWGYEDLDFASRCNTLWPNRRVMGPLYHLWHGERNADDSPADSLPEQVAANLERWQESQ